MPTKSPVQDFTLEIKFGGGIHSIGSEEDIDPRECTVGKNFDLKPQNTDLRKRKSFDKIGTVPNNSRINGFISLLKADGTVSFLVQAHDTVYEWNGITTFTSRGTVSSSARLRGRIEHNWQLTNKVLITDMALAQPVMEWDGTTLQNVTFTDEDNAPFGVFRAKYCVIQNERAIFANIHDNGSNYPHLIVGAKRGDFTNITVSNRASSALSDTDPFFLTQPDLRTINGFVEAFGTMVTSSIKGDLFKITGFNAQNFKIESLYPRSGASGNESVVYAGNDILYGREGAIKSVVDTDRFGDVEANDLSAGISNLIESYNDWLSVYNSRLQRIYFHPVGEGKFFVLHKSMIGTNISPWSLWTTEHPGGFNPTAMMNCFDPLDGLEYVFMGDESGNLYRLEGTGTSDSGTSDIITDRLSKLHVIPLDAEAFQIQGTLWYRKGDEATVILTFEYAGENVFNETVTINIPSQVNTNVYGGSYYGGSYYGSSFSGKLTRKKFHTAGRGNAFQVRVTVRGSTDFEINKIFLRFEAY